MRPFLSKLHWLGLIAFVASGFWAASIFGQPPGGPKGPKGPPINAEFMTVRGTVKEFTTAPKGEVDGVILADGKWVHWPPHLEARFTAIIAKGDRVKAAGYWETGPKGDTKLEVSILTNLANDKFAENPDRPAPAQFLTGDKPASRIGEAQTARGTVKAFTNAPKGEVDGLMLSDGTWVHWPPHLQDRFTAVVSKGDRVKAIGFMETGPRGDTKLEVSTLTNLDTNKSLDNPDRAIPSGARVVPAKSGDLEDRVQALEEKIDRLLTDIERLQRNKK